MMNCSLIPIGPLHTSSRKASREDDIARLDAATTHYDVLGVSKRADAKALQYAWRRAAARWHSDREGGDDVRFKRCELAYAVLSDAARRKHYDETGEDRLPEPVEDDAREVLEQSFAEYLDKAEDLDDGVDFARKVLTAAKQNASRHALHVEQQLAKLRKRAKAIRTKAGKPNFYAQLVAKRIAALESDATNVKKALRVMARAFELLEDYEDAIERPRAQQQEDFASIFIQVGTIRQGFKWP